MSAVEPAVRWLSQGESDVPAGLDWLAGFERERLGRIRFRKRLDDYLLGRWTAKRALALHLGVPLVAPALATLEIRHAPGGAPIAARGGTRLPVEISISDRAGQATCAVAPAGLALGCDLELVEPRSRRFVADYLTETEQGVVARARDACEHDLFANLFWSAKESALKLLGTGLRRDTRSVEIRLASDAVPAGWRRLEALTEEGGTYAGWWRLFSPFVLTVVVAGAVDPPHAMIEPPGLLGARPSHSWIQAPCV